MVLRIKSTDKIKVLETQGDTANLWQWHVLLYLPGGAGLPVKPRATSSDTDAH